MMNNRGFTLIELLIVVALVGILASIAIASYNTFVDKAKVTTAIAALDSVRTELAAYNAEKGRYPSSITSFPNFTDQNNDPILHGLNLEQVRSKIYNWDTPPWVTYESDGNDYIMTARALDRNHTLITVTPKGVTR
ncbi:MAG: prepilin-type N-terminal cleavage/methylation domain-containing protein [Deltaproteobacteria bacterium]